MTSTGSAGSTVSSEPRRSGRRSFPPRSPLDGHRARSRLDGTPRLGILLSVAPTQTDVLWIVLQSDTPPHEWLVHPTLMDRLAADAAEQETTVTDLTRKILCNHFRVPYTPPSRPGVSKVEPGKRILNVKVTPELTAAIGRVYPVRRMDGIRRVLCAHYGLAVPAKPKQRRTRARAAA